ncbi:MAG: GNAT family N-acetyltransferase [Bacillota bacterium]
MTGITLRPALPTDDPFLLAVYASTRQEEMALLPWDERQKQGFLQMQFQAQRQHCEAHYPEALQQVILRDRVPVGRLWLSRKPERIHLLDITLLPEFRGQGIGGSILGELLAEAVASRRHVTIYVESFNPSLRLFERLGFRRASEAGFHFLMNWAPDAPVPGSGPNTRHQEGRSA